MPYLDSLDISNDALRHVGAKEILTIGEDSKEYTLCAAVYDKIRRPELRRNVWTFSCKRTALRPLTATAMEIVPQLWNANQLYLPGSVVSDANGGIWVSVEIENLGNDPLVSNAWDQYFGPMTADLFDPTLTYFAGELVYYAVGTGAFIVFMSLQNANADVPPTPTAWDATVQYGTDAVVTYSSVIYRSLIPYNLNITPANGPLAWNISTTYASGNQVTGSNGFIYTSAVNSNTGNDPTTDNGTNWTATGTPTAWSSSPAQYPASTNWRPLYAGLKTLTFISPVGSGASWSESARNIFRLPANFLREAPQEPKAGSTSYLGAPHGLGYNDWEYDGKFLLSQISTPIMYRFVADVTDVEKFDDMFAAGLAWRMAIEVAEPLTQQSGKTQEAVAGYKMFMTEARMVNAIEQGATEPPVDDYIAARI